VLVVLTAVYASALDIVAVSIYVGAAVDAGAVGKL